MAELRQVDAHRQHRGSREARIGHDQRQRPRLQIGRSCIDLPVESRGIGFVFQSHRLFPHLTVRKNLLFGRRLGGRRTAVDQERKAELLGYFERIPEITGIPVLYITHAADEAERLAKTVLTMKDGRIADIRTPA